jgi:hypothetical protein
MYAYINIYIGMSKIGVIAMAKVFARTEPDIMVSHCIFSTYICI